MFSLSLLDSFARFVELPSRVQLQTLSFLDPMSDLIAVRRCNKALLALSKSELLWRAPLDYLQRVIKAQEAVVDDPPVGQVAGPYATGTLDKLDPLKAQRNAERDQRNEAEHEQQVRAMFSRVYGADAVFNEASAKQLFLRFEGTAADWDAAEAENEAAERRAVKDAERRDPLPSDSELSSNSRAEQSEQQFKVLALELVCCSLRCFLIEFASQALVLELRAARQAHWRAISKHRLDNSSRM